LKQSSLKQTTPRTKRFKNINLLLSVKHIIKKIIDFCYLIVKHTANILMLN